MPAGSDHLLKFQRAEAHLKDFRSQATKWIGSQRCLIFQDKDIKPDFRLIRIVANIPPFPADPFSLLIGDFLHNLRSSLDHVAFALALKHSGTLTERVEKSCEFPIFKDPTYFRDAKAAKIGALHPDAQAVIEGLQPFQSGTGYTYDPLWRLQELSNIDKHRLLLVSALSSVGGVFDYSKFENIECHERLNIPDCIVEGETVVATLSVRPIIPDRKVHVEFRPAVDVVFKAGCGLDGKSVYTSLREMVHYIRDYVFPPLAKYL